MIDIWRAITHAGTALIRAALPCRCALCGHWSPNIVCSQCDQAYGLIRCRVRCACCALPLPLVARDAKDALASSSAQFKLTGSDGLLCGRCLTSPPAFDATLALADYAAPLDTLALALKFNARLAIANYFAQRLALLTCKVLGDNDPFDLVLPVPLSTRRLITRGYNQAWEIARPLAHKLGIPAYPTLMTRVLDTPPQARLDARARQRNMRRAFAISNISTTTISTDAVWAPKLPKPKHQGTRAYGTHRLSGCHIAVVDDVMTSGATLEAIARTLKRVGAARVTNLIALRTPKE